MTPAIATTVQDLDAACLQSVLPVGEYSIDSLAFALGNIFGALTQADIAPLDALDANRIDASCTHTAVVVQAMKPADGCTLVVFGFVEDEKPVTMDIPTGFTLLESGGPSDFVCADAGVNLGQDDDCAIVQSPPSILRDGVVVFHLLTSPTAVNGGSGFVGVDQENVVQSAQVFFSSATRLAPDADGDGVQVASDNCPLHANPTQVNTDAAPLVTPGAPNDVSRPNGDIVGDTCDNDDDNDAILDPIEGQMGGVPSPPTDPPCPASTAATNPLLADTDSDLVVDRAECLLGSDPANASSRPPKPAIDHDGDGLSNAFETAQGFDPFDADADDDTISDGVEHRGYGTSPTSADTDGDGCADGTEIAALDGDTIVGAADLAIVAMRFNRTDRPNIDVNKNGIINAIDLLLVARNFNPSPCGFGD